MKTVEDIECAFPATLKEALELMADESTRGKPLAGGTDLMVQWSSGVLPISDRAISVLGVPELKGIREVGGDVEVGAAVTHAELRDSLLIQQYLPALAAAAATIGGAQIQVRGTIGGNVANASPAGDLAPSLLVTGGSVIVASLRGERQVPLEKFFLAYRKIDLQPDELIVRFTLPKTPVGGRELFRKLGPRAAQAISKVMGSCRAVVEKGTVRTLAIALGSVAPVPIRLHDVEQWIAGKSLEAKVIAEAERRSSELVKPIDDIRSTVEYRVWAAGRIVRGFLEALLL